MENKYLTVTALNRYLKAKIENDVHLNRIYIAGELSNVKYHYSGHCYFTLKDENSRINAVMFQTQLRKVLFKLEDGMKVLAICRLSVYEPQGTYQLYVEKIDVDGLGSLYMAYEKRRLLLEKEGLFSESHKKPIPKYAQDIAVITASSGAAIHDIIKTIRLNCPSCKITLYPSLVQGEQASSMLIRRLKEADLNHHDVIIIGRGGGSLEDLWAFNDESLARTIFQAKTPIISGVGHESDVTICDFVADLRAATPTAAASLATFNQIEFKKLLVNYQNKLLNALNKKIALHQANLNLYKELPIFKRPELIYQNAVIKVDNLHTLLIDRMNHLLKTQYIHQEQLVTNLVYQANLLNRVQTRYLNYQYDQLNKLMKQFIHNKKQQMLFNIQQLNAYNPLQVLERGFTLTLQNDHIITRKEDLVDSLPITIRFSDGDVQAYIKENERNEKNDI